MASRLTSRPAADQVFVDRSGRRRRVVVTTSAFLVALIVAAGAVLAAALVTGGPVAVPGWPAADERARPDSAVIGPRPAPAPAPTTPTARRPGTAVRTSAPPGTGVAPEPTASAHPGRGGGRSNRPTTKPHKSPGKPT